MKSSKDITLQINPLFVGIPILSLVFLICFLYSNRRVALIPFKKIKSKLDEKSEARKYKLMEQRQQERLEEEKREHEARMQRELGRSEEVTGQAVVEQEVTEQETTE